MKINRNIFTFVLGAGASSEVGMPTGNELKQRIADTASNFSFSGVAPNSKVGCLVNAFEKLIESNPELGTRHEFAKDVEFIASQINMATSIDDLLSSHRDNRRLLYIAKIIIFIEILYSEASSNLFDGGFGNDSTISRQIETWYGKFFQIIKANANLEEFKKRLSTVRVISFNYDRTLQFFLLHAIRNFYNCTLGEAWVVMRSLKIYYPYGYLGDIYNEFGGGQIEFGQIHWNGDFSKVAKNIVTFSESLDDLDGSVDGIRESILVAKNLVFLGFAFHPQNLDILFDDKVYMHNKGLGRIGNDNTLYATVYEMSGSNVESIRQRLSSSLGMMELDSIKLEGRASHELLKEYFQIFRDNFD